jgi:V/A-type H+-transporting ATPase subunit E
MEYENLMTSMEASADEKIAELTDKAAAAAQKVRDEAQKKADEIVRAHQDSAAMAMEAESNRALYEARAAVKKEAASVRFECYSRAFDEAEKRLEAFRQNGVYESFFRKAMAESVEALGEKELVLHIDARDEELCRRSMALLGIECGVKADMTCAGGLNASTTDGKVVVFNTLEARLRSARERLKLDVFSALYG